MTVTNEEKLLAEQIVSKAIQMVVFKYNAYAPIISSFNIAYTDIIPTIGVDRYARLVVNPEFIVEDQAYAEGLIIHEVLHIFFGHTTDVRTKLAYTDDLVHNQIANMAEDCAINQFIQESLPDKAITPKTLALHLNIEPKSIDAKQASEYYYDIIMQHKGSLAQQSACSTGEANTQSVQDVLDKMGIKHISQEELSERRLDTAQQMVRSRGNDYGALADFAREMLDPKVDWRQLLSATLKNVEKRVWTARSRQTYKRTSRRSTDILLPKKYGHKLSVALSFDTSGSITADMVNQFLSETQECMCVSEVKECALWHTRNYWYGSPVLLTQNIEKVFESGGTESGCVEECARHCKADIGVTFSDGYWGADPQKPEGCKIGTMLAIIWDGNNIKEIRRLW